MRSAALAAWVLVALPAAGCGPVQKTAPIPQYGLEGSLSVMMGLRYDVAHLDITTNDLAVRFARKQGEGEDTVLKVTAAIADLELVAHGTIDLAEAGPSGAQRGGVSRDVLDDPRRLFPKLLRGRIIFDRVPESLGPNVKGDLSVLFENGTEFASGRTVFGTFEADVL
jgi:hypothetical protein